MIRRRRRPLSARVEADLPITPMLDMSFQLMAFFILTFRPAATEAQLALTLPKADGGAITAAPDLALLDDATELTIQVYASDAGQVVDIVAAPPTGPTALGPDPKAFAEYLTKAKAAAGAGPPPRLKLEFADRLHYQHVVTLIDEAKRAGFDRVGPALLNPQPKK